MSTLQLSLGSVLNNIKLVVLSFILPGATVIDLTINFQVLLDKRGELSGCFIEASLKKVPD